MKLRFTGLVAVFLLTFGIAANAAQDIRIFTTDNKDGKVTTTKVEEAFKAAGFYITGDNNMNKAFDGKFKKHHHKVYNLMTLHNKKFANKLIAKNIDFALFTPLSMSMYTKAGSTDFSVSSMSAEGIAKVTGIKADDADLVAYMKAIEDVFKKAMPNGKFETVNYKIANPKGDLVQRFEMEMTEQGADVEDALEDYQGEVESGLETMGFVLAGFNKLGDDLKTAGNDKYDFLDAYSICKLPVIFEVSKLHPEAGAFAPCTFYMAKEKGSNKVKMAFPSVYNWLSSIDVDDKASVDILIDAQKKFVDTVNESIE